MSTTDRNIIPNEEGVFWQYPVIAIQNDPPASPSNGDCYIVSSTPTGAWVGLSGSLVTYKNTRWIEYKPNDPTIAYLSSTGTLYLHDGSWGAL